MSVIKSFFVIVGMLILGAIGALVFTLFILPYLLINPNFANYQFVKDFKQGKIVVNQQKDVYIQQNDAIEDAIQTAQSSVVTIQAPGGAFQSGLIATSDGLIITLANRIPLDGNDTVYIAGQPLSFTLVKADYQDNLAVIKVNKDSLPTVGFADIGSLQLGQEVFLTASTVATQNNWLADEGIIQEIDPGVIKTDMLEEQAMQGSPLFNSTGQLVGLSYMDVNGTISAVSIDKIQALLGL